MMKRILSILTAALLLFTCAWAEEAAPASPTIVDSGLALMDSSVRYPQLVGIADEALQQQVNNRIIEACDIEDYLSRIALLMQSPVPLNVTWDALLENSVFSCVASASGAVVNERPTHVWTTVNIDLTDGSDITLEDIFVSADEALAAIADYLDYTVAPDLSAHLRNSMLTPVPEQFALSATGLTLYYGIDELSTLSDRAGAVTILWYELREHLNLEAGSVLERIGAKAMLTADTEAIRAAVEAGMLPGIPVALGSSLQEATDTHRMLTDPDLYQDGRMFALEDAAFRKVYLLTDALTDKTWDQSVIKGMRLDRVNLYGLYTGMTRDEAGAILGAADASVTLDADMADAYRLDAGVSDYYNYTGAQLRLHFNTEGLLQSLIITQTE